MAKPSNKALHWELYNTQSVAFMRTQYDDVGYDRLLKRLLLHPEKISPANKIVLIGDQIALMKLDFSK